MQVRHNLLAQGSPSCFSLNAALLLVALTAHPSLTNLIGRPLPELLKCSGILNKVETNFEWNLFCEEYLLAWLEDCRLEL